MILFLLGIGCFLIGLFTFSQAAYIETLVSCASGIWLFILGMNLRRQNHIANASKKSEPSSAQINRPKPPEMIFNAAGVTFDCMFDDKYKNRQKVLKDSLETDFVLLEGYTYRGEPAFALINRRLEADFGNVPKELANQVNELTQKYNYVGFVEKLITLCLTMMKLEPRLFIIAKSS